MTPLHAAQARIAALAARVAAAEHDRDVAMELSLARAERIATLEACVKMLITFAESSLEERRAAVKSAKETLR